MAATTAASLPRLSLPPPAALPAVTSSRFRPDLASVPSRRRVGLRLHRSPVAPAAAASSPSAPSSSPEPGSGIGDALGGVAIFSAATGEPVLIRDLWDQNEGMAVVALLRHFGCPCCWELALTLKDAKERFDSAGVKLIAVGVGTPDKARILAERLPFPLDYLYADPERKAYDLLGLYFGVGRTFFNPASVKVFSRFDSLKEATKNYTIEATPDDRPSVLQQGGMFVFKGKELLYARKDEGTGDHAPLDDVLNICCKVPVA
ncbi:thioredoxin-like protein AAED1, chloroplastic [Hordeum vulgare subsp. vulgare]|uniref:thioredoxin-like protein AAED1, chloroplastic n=1 Tax=Hordeum vulgare subsp. vulgare TaxID=112509 RepID=UPI0002956628|nr:thioredoxin-like protein AAED1, chloroplastic [Hordeum vulgare subsp. vulgare]XP_044980207.1 thioredoxin-like protein AAED1, chloroplastic [Hordeum vulgare subsp. vulgare]